MPTLDRCRRQHLRLAAGLLAAAFATAAPVAQAADPAWPTKPVQMVVGFAAGGGVDAVARMLSTQLSQRLGQQFVVENRPGAAGLISGDRVVRAPADGYTVLLADYSSLTIAVKANPKPPFDIVKGFQPVAMVATMPLVLAVNPSLPVKTVQELAAMAKADPQKLMFASPGIGSAHHLAMEWLKQSMGFEMQHVPYRGAAAMLPDVVSGQVPVAVLSAGSIMAQAKSGQLRVLGVTGRMTVPDAPQWKPIADTVPGFDMSPRLIVLAPAGTPAAVVAKLSQAVKAAVASPEMVQGLARLGGVVTFADGQAVADEMARETAQWTQVVQRAGVTLE